MARKRRAAPAGALRSGAGPGDNSDAQRVRLNIDSFRDVANSEDEFHLNRDQISLNPHPAKRRRRQDLNIAGDPDVSEEEILALPQLGEFEDDGDNTDEPGDFSSAAGDDDDSRARPVGASADGVMSDDASSIEEDLDAQGWGSTRRDYYDADRIETEADAKDEEEEALRLQRRQLAKMSQDDFGLDAVADLEGPEDHDGKSGRNTVRETLRQPPITGDMSSSERASYLQTRHPEFEPLKNDLVTLVPLLAELRHASHAARIATPATGSDSPSLPLATLKWSALSSYLGSLAMYFTLFSHEYLQFAVDADRRPTERLQSHAVIDCLSRCRKNWLAWREVAIPTVENSKATSEAPISQDLEQVKSRPEKKASKKARREAEKAAAAARQAAEAAEQARQAQKQRLADRLATLDQPINLPVVTASATKPSSFGYENDHLVFGEATALTEKEAADKAQRRKSLRFYTAQLAQKASKREAAQRQAGGDQDIPHRERFRDRQERLNAAAEARGRRDRPQDESPGSDAGDSNDPDDAAIAAAVRADGDADADLYAPVANQTQQRKTDRAARKAAHADAARQGAQVRPVESVGPDGKRAISYAIEKNRNLARTAAARQKMIRNPRLKKRRVYQDRQKKLASQRPVYKGGEERGGYVGEKTGISTHVVKSVKL